MDLLYMNRSAVCRRLTAPKVRRKRLKKKVAQIWYVVWKKTTAEAFGLDGERGTWKLADVPDPTDWKLDYIDWR